MMTDELIGEYHYNEGSTPFKIIESNEPDHERMTHHEMDHSNMPHQMNPNPIEKPTWADPPK